MPKCQDIILMVKGSSPETLSFPWGVEQVGRAQNVVLSHFLYKMNGKQLKMSDFSMFALEIIQNDTD